MTINWSGVFPALTTPFHKEGGIDLPMFAKNLEAQLSAGVKGVVIGGTLGEASVLELREKEALVKTALEVVNGRIPVLLNIAEGSLDRARSAVKDAVAWGANGLMVLPPMRYSPDHRETVHWFRSIATASGLPLMIYNNPVDYKTEVTLSMFEELANVPSIQAVKESTRKVENVTRMRNRFGDRYRIMCGVDTIAMDELMAGADGWIAGLVCAFPGETVALFDYCRSGRIKEAKELNQWFMPLLELDIHPKLVQYIKLATAETGLGSEYVREPRLPLEGEERERILGIIRNAIKNKIPAHVH